MNPGYGIFIVLISFASILIGACFFMRPEGTIEMQRRFYAKINWKIEPISMAKELRNTKLMGLFLITVGIGILLWGAVGHIRPHYLASL